MARKALPPVFGEMSAAHIVRTFRRADESQMARGMSWYADAHTFAIALDAENVARAAGIIAALSPRLQWPRNMLLASRVYADGSASGTLGGSCRKADAIFTGAEPLSVLSGSKVRNFYRAILDPTSGAVVVDRHAFDIACNRVTDDETRAILSKRDDAYEYIADLYREAAAILGVSPTQVQAVTWTVWRETDSAYRAANVRALAEDETAA